MTDLELLIALVHSYAPEMDTERIERAYEVAAAAHAGQTRASGEPYVIHPLATAKILADLYMDGDTIVAGLLHDVPEDTLVTLDELRAILMLARERGLWIVADEIYGRFYYAGARAPSFHDVMDETDRVLFVNTMSKNWAMTGWRSGWLEAPPALGQAIENMIQYSTSGVPLFVQRAAIEALDNGEEFVALQRSRAEAGRAALIDTLGPIERLRFAAPEGSFYFFLSVVGEADTRAVAFRLVDEAGVGLAPGKAFGQGGEAFLRLCFARDPTDIAEAARRIAAWVKR